MTQPSPLASGVRALLTCDSGAVVSGIVDFVLVQNRIVRLLSSVMQRVSWLATTVIVINGIRCFAGVYLVGGGDTVVVARRPNERRAMDRLKSLLPRQQFGELRIGWRPASMIQALAALTESPGADLRRTVRLARLLTRRYGVFHALRVVELLAYYRRYSELLTVRWFRLAVMSTHSNPHGIALNLVARRFDVPVVLITHGMPIRPLARLHYDVAIHECEASAQLYREAGCRMDHVVIKSRRADYVPMRASGASEGLTVGLFLSKDPAGGRVEECVHMLLEDPSVRRIVIRPHPVNLWRGLSRFVGSLREPRVILHAKGSLADDLQQCDVVLAGNSTVLLDAVLAGRAACYVRGLDHGPQDVQGFVRDGLVCEWTPSRRIDRAAIARFYQRSEWPDVLRRYADIDRGEHEMGAELRVAVDSVTSTGIRAVA